MATIKIASLPSATAIDDADLLILDQADSTRKLSISQFKDDLDFVTQSSLTSSSGASQIGTLSGNTIQEELNLKADSEDIIPSKINYTANLSTIARTVQTALDDFVNLHDYYLTSDPDWTNAFTRALSVSTNILIPFGTHVVGSTVNLPTNSKIIGLGAASIVKSPDADDAAGTRLVTVFRGDGVDNILISNLTVDGGVNEINTTKKIVRTVRFVNCTNVTLFNLRVLNNADWSTSFEGGHDFIVRNYYQRSYKYINTSINLNGGRDGLHFMDCYNVLAEGLDIESGDDCVGITTTGTNMSNITIRTLRGSSNIASLVIYNEETDSSGNYYSNTLNNLVIEDIAVKTGGLARNIVRVVAYGATTVIKDVTIKGIRGTAYNSYGLWLNRVSNVNLSDINVYSRMVHGIYITTVDGLSGSASGSYTGESASASYAGVNLSGISNSTFTPISKNSYGYGIQILTATNCTFYPDAYNNGSGLFSTAAGGNLRIVNSVAIKIPSGRAVGDNTVSYWGILQTGNTDLDIALEFVYAGFTNSVLPNNYYLKAPTIDIKFKEDSAGTITTHLLVGGTFVRNSIGNYTLTFTKPMRSTNFSWTATAYRNGALVFVRLASAVGTSSITLQVVDASNVATYADHIEFKAFNAGA